MPRTKTRACTHTHVHKYTQTTSVFRCWWVRSVC
uniref:Uncharacterized protein n=1 Tax=Anopheles arabiensis TaxID=7173 RepID=A0A182IG03_ANOAR